MVDVLAAAVILAMAEGARVASLPSENAGVLRFAQNDKQKAKATTTAKATTEADPYGMTSKKGNGNRETWLKGYGCVDR